MHIAFLTSEYPPLPSGGIGTSIRNLARALAAMGHRVTVIGWGPETAFDDEGVRVRFLGHTRIPKLGWLLNRRRVAREINRLVREEGLDIVEAPDWCGISAGLIPAELKSLKVSKSENRKVEEADGLKVQRSQGVKVSGSGGQRGEGRGGTDRLGDRGLLTDHGPQTIAIGPGTTDQGPRITEAAEQSPERSERGGGSKSGCQIQPRHFVLGSVAPPADAPPSASPTQPSAFRFLLSAFCFRVFLVRHLGFRIACPLVIRCHGTATYFARLEQLQDEVEAKRQHAEPQDQERRTRDEGRGTKNDAPRLRVKPLVRWTEGLALRQASSIVAVSRFCAETTAELFGLQGDRSLFTVHCSLLTVKGSGVSCQVSGMEQGSGFRVQGSDKTRRGSLKHDEGRRTKDDTTVNPVSRFTPHVSHSLIRVIPNGIDIRQFTPARPDEIEPDTLLYFGTLARKKGVLDLADIFNRVVEQVPQARLRLIGRDNPDVRIGAPSTWELMQRDFSPAARNRVEYLGTKPYAEIQEHVRRAGVCIFPSYAEAFPVSWLEAMACAKPVVAYDIGWAQEVIESGVSGSLVRPGDTAAFADAVVACLRSPQRATDMGLRARQRVRQYFDADAVARQSLAWYTAVSDCTL